MREGLLMTVHDSGFVQEIGTRVYGHVVRGRPEETMRGGENMAIVDDSSTAKVLTPAPQRDQERILAYRSIAATDDPRRQACVPRGKD